jgi:hypothetical protein
MGPPSRPGYFLGGKTTDEKTWFIRNLNSWTFEDAAKVFNMSVLPVPCQHCTWSCIGTAIGPLVSIQESWIMTL